MSVLNTVHKITAQVGKTAVFTNWDLGFGIYHVIILMLLFNQIENCGTII